MTTVLDLRPVDDRTVYKTINDTVSLNGALATGLGNTYYANVGDVIDVSVTLADADDNIQTQIDAATLGYPPILKVPFIKRVSGPDTQVIDQIYLSATIVEGVITASGTIPSSGAWVFSTERINEALASIRLDWRVTREDTYILV